MIKIQIEYILDIDNQINVISISENDYFEKLDDDEYDIFNTPSRHFLEPREYIKKEDYKSIVQLNIYLEDDENNRIVEKTTYWNKGENQFQEHLEFKGERLSYRTIISNVQIENDKYLLLRMDEVNGSLAPISHSIFDNDNKSVVNML